MLPLCNLSSSNRKVPATLLQSSLVKTRVGAVEGTLAPLYSVHKRKEVLELWHSFKKYCVYTILLHAAALQGPLCLMGKAPIL